MNIIEVVDYIYDTEDTSEENNLRGYTIEGNWKGVENLYKLDPKFSTINIKSRGTALHVAVNDNNGDVVRNLVASIISHNNEKALKCKNEKGDTPLHLAASRGFKDICESIIGKDGERKELIDIDNNAGETPLFLAALSWQKQTFVYLLAKRNNGDYPLSKDLIRSNGDSILHCAITREFFDLALIIIDKYPNLISIPNKEGFSPLKLLATRPSAFKSGCKMIWWKRVLYHCIPVGILNVKEAIENYGKEQESCSHDKCPKNYDTCYLFFQKCTEKLKGMLKQTTCTAEFGSKDMGEKHKLLPENYVTCLWFMKFAWIYILGLSGVGVEEIKKMKQKHKWSGQLLSRFMENPYESCFGTGAKPKVDVSGTDFMAAYKPNQGDNKSEEPKISTTLESETTFLTAAKNDIVKIVDELITKIPKISTMLKSETTNLTDAKKGMVEIVDDLITKIPKISETLKSETAILTAARNGIIEIVDEIITKIPSSIYDVNLENKNVLLVAVENRRTNVVEALWKRLEKCNKKAIFDNLIQGVDKEDNTVLHLAAARSDLDWHISGAALQMMWHIKWFQYTKGLVPEHFTVRTNKKDKTAGELFKKSYTELVKLGSEWLKDTSESCSVVAALLAGVSFATSSTVPGGNKSDTGEPTLEGKPAFDAFAMCSITGLCFSVTALIMFLSILTSRKEARDFRIDLPRKLLLGLSSLFLSIIAMFITFCSGHFFLIDQKFKHAVLLIYTVTSIPVALYAVAQLPLYIDLLIAIVTEVPKTSGKGENL
ncbi:uncharacterized protein LOC131656518 isoform X1 [Vicia villosa]|uniref:uncharacterized protein LOC131656518 isoform X1 n=1 Tax=Vicia villosa TaxID=3911 RepID=UPI00273AE090|nr:uncharacterized protein LOC131656518 isoform X1 [Vicia villosa]